VRLLEGFVPLLAGFASLLAGAFVRHLAHRRSDRARVLRAGSIVFPTSSTRLLVATFRHRPRIDCCAWLRPRLCHGWLGGERSATASFRSPSPALCPSTTDQRRPPRPSRLDPAKARRGASARHGFATTRDVHILAQPSDAWPGVSGLSSSASRWAGEAYDRVRRSRTRAVAARGRGPDPAKGQHRVVAVRASLSRRRLGMGRVVAYILLVLRR
jgi:hypothetical protein